MISIRTYKPNDYEAVKELYSMAGSFGGEFDPDRDSQDRMNEQVARNSNSILIAEEDGKVLGTVSILQDRRFAWLIRFAVIESREKEVSEKLFGKAAEILKENGHSQVLVYGPLGHPKFNNRYENLSFVTGSPYTAFWRSLD